jgi:hypothetical protein
MREVRRVGFVSILIAGVIAVGAGSATAADGPLDITVAGVAEVAGAVVTPVAEPVVEAVAPVVASVAEPVAETVAPVTEPVIEVVQPVVEETVAPVVEAAQELASPVVEPVAEIVAPVRELVEETAAPLLDAVAPVIDVVDDVIPPTPVAGSPQAPGEQQGAAGGGAGGGPKEPRRDQPAPVVPTVAIPLEILLSVPELAAEQAGRSDPVFVVVTRTQPVGSAPAAAAPHFGPVAVDAGLPAAVAGDSRVSTAGLGGALGALADLTGDVVTALSDGSWAAGAASTAAVAILAALALIACARLLLRLGSVAERFHRTLYVSLLERPG